jgi:hypothetical protein
MKLTMRKACALVGVFFLGALAVLAYQYRTDLVWIPLLALLLSAQSSFFWIFLLTTLSIFLVVSSRRRWSRWTRALGAAVMVVVALPATGLWFLLFVDGPLFNLAAPLTNEFAVYEAECKGWVYRPGESIGGSATCYGYYGHLGDSVTTYVVNVPQQKVWMWQEPTMVGEPKGGWVSLTQPSADPGVKSTCQVRDYANWACTDSDQYGTTITQLVGGRKHSYEHGQTNPSDRLAKSFLSLARCDVQVDAVTWSRLWLKNFLRYGPLNGRPQWEIEALPLSYAPHPGLPAGDWTDCANPPA